MAHDTSRLDACIATFQGAAYALTAALSGPPPSSLTQYQAQTAQLVTAILDAAVTLTDEVKRAFAAMEQEPI